MSAESAFLELFKTLMPTAATVSQGTVESVDTEKHTCDVIRDGQPTLINSRLNAVIDTLDDYVVAYPKVGSYVLCVTIDEPTASYVLAMTQVDEYRIKIGEMSLIVNKKDIVMNDGALGGLPVVGDVASRLNLLEKAFNSLLSDYKAHNHTHPQGATTGLLTPPVTNSVSETKVSDIENVKVKQ